MLALVQVPLINSIVLFYFYNKLGTVLGADDRTMKG